MALFGQWGRQSGGELTLIQLLSPESFLAHGPLANDKERHE